MRAALLVFSIFLIIACGGGGSDVISGPTISDSERHAIITNVEREVENLTHPNQSATQLNAAVLAYVQTVPQFVASGVTTEECVWARFSDGRYLVIGNNRYPERFQRSPVRTGRSSLPPPAGNVSTSSTARLFHTFGAGFLQQQDPIDEMVPWLTAAGYAVDRVGDGDGRLSTLRSIGGTGFLYLNSHAGSFVKPDGTKVFMVLSSTVKTAQTDAQAEIAADLADGSVVYGTYTNGQSTTNDDGETVPARDTRYGFTSKFVDKYWTLGSNAIVFFNACWSGYTGEPGAAHDMIASLKAKGAGVFLGWTAKAFSPASEDVPRLLVDRLCGSNEFRKETPDQRPFFVEEIVAEMHRENVVPDHGADLVVFKKNGSNGGLRPTIHYLDMSEPFGVLELYGAFGDVQGKVTVGGVQATVQGVWTNENINVKIPDSGPGSFGDVVVTANNKTSNVRRLTKWVSTAKYTENSNGSLRCVVNAKIVIRADLARRRQRPGDPVDLTTPIPLFASKESTCSFTASGIHQNGQTVIEAWAGSGTVALTHIPFNDAQAKWFCNGAFDPVTREFAIGFMCGGPKVITGQVGNASVPAGGASYTKTLDSTWTGAAQNVTGSPATSFSAFVPQSPPDPNMQYKPRW